MSTSLLHHPSWAQTSRGTNLEMWSWQTPHTEQVLFIGGVHGDEPEGVQLAQHLLKWLQSREHSADAKSLAWSGALIPCLNKDGWNSQQRVNGRGVDLNRNFPAKNWSSAAKAPRYFPGPAPGSEPEVQAVVGWIEKHRPRLIVHFHSWEPCVVYTGAPGLAAARVLAGQTGFQVREDIGYPTPGSLGEYAWSEFQIPVICIESPEKISGPEVWRLFGQGLQDLLQTDWRLLL